MRVEMRIDQSMALMDDCLSVQAIPASMALADDPLRLDLPPLAGPGAGPSITPQGLRILAALYLQSEMEQAGIIPVAELLTAARANLDLLDHEAARKLDELHVESRRFYTRQQREIVFARVFGSGRGASADQGNLVNSDFQRALAAFCYTVLRYEEDLRWSNRPSVTLEAAIKQASFHLVLNLAPRFHGNAVVAARTIGEHLRKSISLLQHRGIEQHFTSQGMWDTLRKILGNQAPDFGRLIGRGQSGMKILGWLAQVLPQVTGPASPDPLIRPHDEVFVHAARWMQASGLAAQSPQAGRAI